MASNNQTNNRALFYPGEAGQTLSQFIAEEEKVEAAFIAYQLERAAAEAEVAAAVEAEVAEVAADPHFLQRTTIV